MQSSEYPDLQFVEPAAWGSGRDGNSVQYIVVHYTAGSEGPSSAENGAAYDARRTDGTSTHYFADSDSVVQCVYTWNRANAAFSIGNRRGIQYELCGTQQTREQWLDPVSRATIRNAARQMARDCAKYGLPVRKIGPSEMNAGLKGICGHADVTMAYGLGDHMDPGAAFPYDVLLADIGEFMNPQPEPTPTKRRRDENMEYVWYLASPLTYAVERPYHPSPAMRWEEGNVEHAVGWLNGNGINASTLLTATAWNARKARYAEGGVGAF